MSFQGATQDLNKDERFSTLKLVGGNDCYPELPFKTPDLDVDGGMKIRKSALIKKDLTVRGNLYVDECIVVNGNIKSGVDGQDIIIEGNLCVTGNIKGITNGGGSSNVTTNCIQNTLTTSKVCTNDDETITAETNGITRLTAL